MLSIDAMSVYQAVTASHLKPPSEKSLAGHIFWLRELLDLGIISWLQWLDTRDMSADGHTKGSVDRKVLLDLMRGILDKQHPSKEFQSHKFSFSH